MSNEPQSKSFTEKAQDKAQHTAQTVGDKTQEASDKAQDYVAREADKRSGQAGHWMQKTGRDLHDTSKSLREKGDPTMAGLIDAAASGLETYGSRIQDMDAGEIRDELAGFIRDNVWAVAAGTLFVGLAASRVLRVSAEAAAHDRGGREQRSRQTLRDVSYGGQGDDQGSYGGQVPGEGYSGLGSGGQGSGGQGYGREGGHYERPQYERPGAAEGSVRSPREASDQRLTPDSEDVGGPGDVPNVGWGR